MLEQKQEGGKGGMGEGKGKREREAKRAHVGRRWEGGRGDGGTGGRGTELGLIGRQGTSFIYVWFWERMELLCSETHLPNAKRAEQKDQAREANPADMGTWGHGDMDMDMDMELTETLNKFWLHRA